MKTSKIFVQLFVVLTLIAGLIGLGYRNQSASAKPAAALGAWTQQWADEFNGTGALNTANWIYDIGTGYGCGTCAGWGTGEIEYNTNSTANVNQTGGHLAITALHTGTDPVAGWTSGRIETQRTDFQPPAGGAMAIEASIQQPNVTGAAAKGYWPAFWALGAPFRGVYTNWPGIGELDVLEDVNGESNVYGTLHCGVNPGGPCSETNGIGSGAHTCTGCQTAYHTYRIEFDKSVSPEQLRWYLDGVNYFTINANQVDATTWANATNHGFFVILNLAMGGGWPGNPTSATTPGLSMNVDYVRVYYANSGTAPTSTPISGSSNLALNKPATSSSNETTSLTPNLAVDGNTTTRWASVFSDPQWLQVDLGATKTINRVVLNWEAAYANAYQIQTSNDATNWTTIYSRTSGAGGINDLTGLSGSGRYVRMYGTTRATAYGYSLYEFEVYGSGGTSPTATPVPTGDFSQSVSSVNSTSSKVTFVSNVASVYVDIHYTGVPGLGQQNVRMAQSGNTWTQTITGITAGNIITYWFTYEKAGLAYDSAHFTFTK